MNELELIETLERRFRSPSPSVEVGVGDDAAIVASGGGMRWALTTDAMVEGVHFDLALTDPERLGRKALAINLSDLAAMGSRPRHCLLALMLPAETEGGFVDRLLDGVEATAREHRVSVVGGNLSRGPCLSITVTAVGELSGPALTRDGGRPGDRLLLTGEVGSSALGLELLRRGPAEVLPPELAALVERHLDPTPRVAVGEALRGIARAAIDISDGLAQDAGHLARASRCGARIHLARLPLAGPYRALTADREDPFGPALGGGEDYELLFAVPEMMVRTAVTTAAGVGCALHEIGALEEGSGVVIEAEDGSERPAPAGYRHF